MFINFLSENYIAICLTFLVMAILVGTLKTKPTKQNPLQVDLDIRIVRLCKINKGHYLYHCGLRNGQFAKALFNAAGIRVKIKDSIILPEYLRQETIHSGACKWVKIPDKYLKVI